MNKDIKAYIAEFIGTFALVFLGSGAVWFISTTPGYAGGTTIPAFAHGIAIVFAAYSIGSISGAHLNPAVTVAVAIAGGIGWVKAAIYIVVQVIAAIVAALVLSLFLPAGAAANFGAFTYNATSTSSIGALFLEAIMTFMLAFIVCQGAVKGKAGSFAGLAIGLTLAANIFAFGGVTGASLNPARSLGPAIIAGNLSQIWIYIVGPVLGAAVAAVVSRYVLTEDNAETPAKRNTGRRTN